MIKSSELSAQNTTMQSLSTAFAYRRPSSAWGETIPNAFPFVDRLASDFLGSDRRGAIERRGEHISRMCGTRSTLAWLVAIILCTALPNVGRAADASKCGDADFGTLRPQFSQAPVETRTTTTFLPSGGAGQLVLRKKYDDTISTVRLFETNGSDTKTFHAIAQPTVLSLKPAPEKLVSDYNNTNGTLVEFLVPEHKIFPLWHLRSFVTVACLKEGPLVWGLAQARVSSGPVVAIICIAALAVVYFLVTVAVAFIRNRDHPLGSKYPAYQAARRFSIAQTLDPVRLTADVFNRASVQKLQIFLFSFLVAGMLLALALAIGQLSDLSTTVLGLLGISGVGAAVAQATSSTRTRLSFDNWAWLVRHRVLPISQQDAEGPSWGDLVLTNREFDIYKLQTIVFSVVVAVALLVAGGERLASFTIPEALPRHSRPFASRLSGGFSHVRVRLATSTTHSSELRKREDTLRTSMLYNTDADADGKLPALTGKQPIANPSLSTTNTPIALQRYRAQQRQVALMIELILEVSVDERQLDPDLNFS